MATWTEPVLRMLGAVPRMTGLPDLAGLPKGSIELKPEPDPEQAARKRIDAAALDR